MKAYCTQNNGDCETCSLVNYGRDCHNQPLMEALQRAIIRLIADRLKGEE